MSSVFNQYDVTKLLIAILGDKDNMPADIRELALRAAGTPDERLNRAIDDFIAGFDRIDQGVFVNLARDGVDLEDEGYLKLVAGGTLSCIECGSSQVEEQTVYFDAHDEVIRRDDDMPKEHDDFDNAESDDPEEGGYAYEEEKHVCQGCGFVGESNEFNRGTVYGEYGLPAWNTLFHDRNGFIKAGEAEAAGFVVYESDYYQGLVLGVDGAGYSFRDDHWTKLYHERGLKWHEVNGLDELLAQVAK